MTAPVLNPALYSRMIECFDRVRVSAPGQPLAGYYDGDPVRGGTKLYIVSRGETYHADCPLCGDRRGRLAVNHRYGVYDAHTDGRGRELWKCYNEECQQDWRHRADLDRLLNYHWLAANRGPQFATPRIAPARATVLPPCEFPGVLVSVGDLPVTHPVAIYLRDCRGFDLAELSTVWGVALAEHVPARSRGAMAQGRIIAPVVMGGVPVGWQARYPDDLDWKAAGIPKYLTYFPKSLAVYGLDQATDAALLIVVEGVTDVWRYGPGAVCGFGKGLSPTQADLVAKAAAGRPVLIAPDADDPDSEAAFFEALERVVALGHRGLVGVVLLPLGKDPGDLTRAQLHARVQMTLTALRDN